MKKNYRTEAGADDAVNNGLKGKPSRFTGASRRKDNE